MVKDGKAGANPQLLDRWPRTRLLDLDQFPLRCREYIRVVDIDVYQRTPAKSDRESEFAICATVALPYLTSQADRDRCRSANRLVGSVTIMRVRSR